MGRIYTKQFKSLAVTNVVQDVWALLGGVGDRLVTLLEFEMTSSAIVAAAVVCDIHRITAFGSGGSAPGGEEPHDENDSAADASIRVLDTTPGANGGGCGPAYEWEQLTALCKIWTPKSVVTAQAGEGFAFYWGSTVAATLSGFVTWEEN